METKITGSRLLALNKPKGYMVTRSDELGRRTVYDLLPTRVFDDGAKTRLRVQIDEGKNRHIRRLFGAMKDPKFGTPLKVLELSRVSIGSLKLDIESGKWRHLSIEEEEDLLKDFR